MISHRDIGIEPRAKVPSDRHRINVGITYADMGDNYLIKLLRCTNNKKFSSIDNSNKNTKIK